MNALAPQFNARTHCYTVAGRVVPSVTEVLAPLCDFRGVPVYVLRAAAAFGAAVHKACELDDLGLLDESALDPQLAGSLHGWRTFCKEHGARWKLVEAPLFHPDLGYAGTVDRYGLVDGADAVVDLKTTTRLYPSVGPQLAAYARAIAGTTARTRRLAVQLHVNGRYHLREYDSPTDWAVFASLLTLRNFCQQHRITPYYGRRP